MPATSTRVFVVATSLRGRARLSDAVARSGACAICTAADPGAAAEHASIAEADAVLVDLHEYDPAHLFAVRHLHERQPDLHLILVGPDDSCVRAVAALERVMHIVSTDEQCDSLEHQLADCLEQLGTAGDVVATPPSEGDIDLVAIAASTGGPQALGVVLEALPAELAAPVVIVQHMPRGFTSSLAAELNGRSALDVREGTDDLVLRPGMAVLAPAGHQLRLARVGVELRTQITDDPPEHSCRPAADYLFRSVAEVIGAHALAVVLTGIGQDGAAGCRLLRQRGATILTQDEASCTVYGMPRIPTEEGLAAAVLPLSRMAREIKQRVGTVGK